MIGEIRATLLLLILLCFSVSALPLASATEDSWTIMEPMSIAKASVGVAVLDNIIYAMGGSYDSNSVEEYDPVSNSWAAKTPMPTPRIFFGIAVVENKIYVIGGDAGNWDAGEILTNINEVYDPSTDTWETRTSMPTRRLGLTSSVVDGKIYCIGGRTGEPGYTKVSATEIYDPSTDTWTTGKRIPIPVSNHASAVVNKRIFIMGGEVGVTLNQVYDPETDTWSNGTPLPIGVDQAAAAVTAGDTTTERVYLVGGKQNLDAVNFNQVYDPETDIWVEGTLMPTARFGLGVAVVEYSLYAIGGREGWFGFPISSANERYMPADFIPEFPSWLLLPLFLIATLSVIVLKKRITSKT